MKKCEYCDHSAHPWVVVRYRPILAHLDGELGRCDRCECSVDVSGKLHTMRYRRRKIKTDDQVSINSENGS